MIIWENIFRIVPKNNDNFGFEIFNVSSRKVGHIFLTLECL